MNIEGVRGGTWPAVEVERDEAFRSKYRLEHELGVGGSGVVMCARHLHLDERVAIKFLRRGLDVEGAFDRFRLEARVAHRVKSEHVARVLDVSTTAGGIPFIVMEYLEGLDLERMLRQSPTGQLPVPDAVDFVLQACEAIAESHVLGIVHRDLKPSNLFCVHGADGLPVIKVLDFGISKLSTSSRPARENAIVGSPRYMSPEQFDAPADVDERADIWAIGAILYELVTGKVPFDDPDLLELRKSIRHTAPVRMGRLRADVPSALEPIVATCLQKDRSERYASLGELAKALLPCAPPRSRPSVNRIVRILEAPGCTTGSLSLLPQEVAGATDRGVALPGDRYRAALARWPSVVLAVLAGVSITVVGLRSSTKAPAERAALDARSPESPPAPPPPPENARLAVQRAPESSPMPSNEPGRAQKTVAAEARMPKRLAHGEVMGPVRTEADARAATTSSRASTTPGERLDLSTFAASPPESAETRPTSSATPHWVTDIVEQRKGHRKAASDP
jgi:serine/threonine-protein kinase